MDKKKAFLNITISLSAKIVTLVVVFFARRFLIIHLGNDANGLYSLFISILGFLSLAELGIGAAITFSMYRPIVENDTVKLAALYHLSKKIFTIIGMVIFTVGLLLTPLIPMLAKDYAFSNIIYFDYVLYLLATTITYFFACETTLINAYKNNYITSSIRSIGLALEGVLQIIIVYQGGGFTLFITVIVVSNILQWLATRLSFKPYKANLSIKHRLDTSSKQMLLNNTFAMFLHKIGGVLIYSSSNIIISAFLGVYILGIYSNYLLITSGINTIVFLFFTSILSILGHFYVEKTKKEYFELFNIIYTIGIVLGAFIYLGFYATADIFIASFFGQEFLIDKTTLFLIAVYNFAQFVRQPVLIFKDASGNFYRDRFKPIFEGIVNLVLSIVLVNHLGINGVLIALIFTNIAIGQVIESHVLFKYGFELKVLKYNINNFLYFIVFCFTLLSFSILSIKDTPIMIYIIQSVLASLVISILYVFIFFLFNKNFRNAIIFTMKNVRNTIKTKLLKKS